MNASQGIRSAEGKMDASQEDIENHLHIRQSSVIGTEKNERDRWVRTKSQSLNCTRGSYVIGARYGG